jgi:hypothetical protein
MTTDEVSILTKWPLTDELSTDEKTTDEVSMGVSAFISLFSNFWKTILILKMGFEQL